MCFSSEGYVAYYRELADKLDELTRLVRQGSQNLALVERLSELTAQIRQDIDEPVLPWVA